MPAQPDVANRGYLSFLAYGFIASVCLALMSLSAWREWEARAVDLRNAEIDVTNLARSLTQHAEDTFELTEAILVGLVNRLETDGTTGAAIAKLQNFLFQRRPDTRVKSIFVYDEVGRWLATTEKIDFSSLDNSDRDYFQRHRASDRRETIIGLPIRSRSTGDWIVTASRRFNNADGSFAGVGLVTIEASYFARFYEKFDVGPHGAISLLSSSGIIMARSFDVGSIGRDLSASQLIRELPSRPAEGVHYFDSPVDGIPRLSFYSVSQRYPLLIVATKATDDALTSWRRTASMRMSFAAALSVLFGSVGFYIVRQLKTRHRMTAALIAKEGEFRLLAEQSSDMVMRIDLNETVTYVSPSVERVLGWHPAQITGTSALVGINVEDLPKVRSAVASLRTGELQEVRIAYRTRHKERGEAWIETALRSTTIPATGEIDGVVAISRDVSQQKELEDRLSALATLDGLTGLANRRQFDDHIKAEWSRARRHGTTLSLLMIDVDNFKKFNDTYGHQAGDECLQTIADILDAHAVRPADLVARYGGEEFALLLPDTNAPGCANIGHRLREALRDIAFPHARNAPSGIVTVSIGGATLRPSDLGPTPVQLVQDADQALYSAKNEGRDRLVMSARATEREVTQAITATTVALLRSMNCRNSSCRLFKTYRSCAQRVPA